MRDTTEFRTFVVVDSGYPDRGRRGYRGLGTVQAPSRADARAQLAADPFYPAGYRLLWLMRPRDAGPRLLLEALAADGRRVLVRERAEGAS